MPTFLAVALSPLRVRIVFSETMQDNAALRSDLSYLLTDIGGVAVPVTSVELEQTAPVSVVLVLGAGLQSQKFYHLGLSPLILSSGGGTPVSPSTTTFQWSPTAGRISVPVSRFSGGVPGPYGLRTGRVFFSPALEESTPDSVIQVDEVQVCTRAYDQYVFPQIPDPPVLFTHGAGVVPTPAVTVLNTHTLWAPFPRMCEAKLNLGLAPSDAMPHAVSSRAIATVREPWDLDHVALLDNPSWKLFDNAGTPPRYFITANNLAVIPPGGEVTITLEP